MYRILCSFVLMFAAITWAAPPNLPSLKKLEAAYKGKQAIGVAATLRSDTFQDAIAQIVPTYKVYLYKYHHPKTPKEKNAALIKLKDIESSYSHQLRTSARVSGTDIANTAWIRDPGVRAAIEGSLVTFSKIDDLHKLGLYGTGQDVFLIDEGRVHASKVLAVLQMIAPHATFIQNRSTDLDVGGTSKIALQTKKHLPLDNVRYLESHDFDVNFERLKVGVVNFSAYYINDSSRRAFLHRLQQYPKVVFVQAMSNDGTAFPAPYVLDMDDRSDVDAKKKKMKDVRRDFSLIPEIVKAPNLMLAIAVTYHATIASFSSRPGSASDYPKSITASQIDAMQNMSVSALGDQILFHGVDGKDGRHWGTSFATPIISGTVSLLREAFPKLPSVDIIQSILRAAEKDFYIPHTRSTQCGTFVYSGAAPAKKHPGCTYQKFDPAYYGRGIVNAKLAYDFAAMREHHREKSLDEIEAMFLAYKHKRETLAAKKIQRAWRGPKKAENDHREKRARVARRAAAKAKEEKALESTAAEKAKTELQQRQVDHREKRARIARRAAAKIGVSEKVVPPK